MEETMKAGDIMTRNVITIDPDSTVVQAAQRMIEHRISGMPVVDQSGRVLGIISEGDLLHRAETGTERRSSWWLGLVAGATTQGGDLTRDQARPESARLNTNNPCLYDAAFRTQQTWSPVKFSA